MDRAPNQLVWVAGRKKEFLTFPKAVVQDVGHALYIAQCGDKPHNAKPLKGFSGAGVLEVLENHDGDTYRAVYTVRFEDAIYVLHCFQKQSKSGIATPQQDIELVKTRLKAAEEESKEWFEKQKRKS
jgi:phage-related protein